RAPHPPSLHDALPILLRALHGSGARVTATFSGLRIGESYAQTARVRGAEVPASYERAHASAKRIEAAFAAADGAGGLGGAGHSGSEEHTSELQSRGHR